MRPLVWLFVLTLWGFGTPLARAAPAMRSVQDVIAATAGAPTHIVFIHGIRTDSRGASFTLQGEICRYLGPCTGITRSSTQLLLGPAPNATYVGRPVWASQQQWDASQPFVDHYVYHRKGKPPLIVDEINWWPFVFPLKCQLLLPAETQLVGPNNRTIELCGNLRRDRSGAFRRAFDDHYPWFSEDAVRQLLTEPTLSGHPTAIFNHWIKSEIVDWGLSDAVVSLGATKDYLRLAVRCALYSVASFDPSSATEPITARQISDAAKDPTRLVKPKVVETIDCKNDAPPTRQAKFVIVSHSLGSFLLLDTFAAAAGDLRDIDEKERRGSVHPAAGLCEPDEADEGAGAPSRADLPDLSASDYSSLEAQRLATLRMNRGLCFVLRNGDELYFLANQFPLLELGRIEGLQTLAIEAENALGDWAKIHDETGATKQIVAFSDPNDLLTFEVPCIAGARVFNVPVANDIAWFYLIERPDTAHTGYFTNKNILRTVFAGGAPSDTSRWACAPTTDAGSD